MTGRQAKEIPGSLCLRDSVSGRFCRVRGPVGWVGVWPRAATDLEVFRIRADVSVVPVESFLDVEDLGRGIMRAQFVVPGTSRGAFFRSVTELPVKVAEGPRSRLGLKGGVRIGDHLVRRVHHVRCLGGPEIAETEAVGGPEGLEAEAAVQARSAAATTVS